MDYLDASSNVVWFEAPPEDSGGSNDRFYAAQGESVQTPANVPPTSPPVERPVTREERADGSLQGSRG